MPLNNTDVPGANNETLFNETIVLPYNDGPAVREAFDRRGGEIACIVVEPIAANMGVVPPEAGFLVVQLAADAAVAQVDWPGAAAVLQEFVTRVPNHIPALMRLVEICVDGGLESTMFSAQAQLADA